MKISNDTLAVLKNFTQINPSILIREGNRINTMSLDKNLYAEATLPDEFDEDIPIYDLREFLSTLALFKEPEISVKETELEIKGERSKCYYELADEQMIRKPKIFLEIPEDAFDISFELKSDDIQQLLKASSSMNLPNIAFCGADGKVVVKAFNSKDETANEFVIEIDDYDGADFKAVTSLEYLKLINIDYTVSLQHEKAIQLDSPVTKYIIAMESSSYYKGE